VGAVAPVGEQKAHIIGVVVSETTSEIIIATDKVIAIRGTTAR
jgi:hypothetical protein